MLHCNLFVAYYVVHELLLAVKRQLIESYPTWKRFPLEVEYLAVVWNLLPVRVSCLHSSSDNFAVVSASDDVFEYIPYWNLVIRGNKTLTDLYLIVFHRDSPFILKFQLILKIYFIEFSFKLDELGVVPWLERFCSLYDPGSNRSSFIDKPVICSFVLFDFFDLIKFRLFGLI